MGSGGKTGSLLVCRVGTKLCALPLSCLLETMRPLAVEALTQTADFVSGVALIRGRPTPVVDARKLLGSPSDRPPGRYVTLDLGERGARVAALAVDAVVGVRDVPEGLLGELPGLLGGSPSSFVGAVTTLDAELLLVLEQARLVPEDVWQRLEQKGAPT
jgi:purine-binding chemotaxis protein CheW